MGSNYAKINMIKKVGNSKKQLKYLIQNNYGISEKTSIGLFQNTGINCRQNFTALKKKKMFEINKKIKTLVYGMKLKQKIRSTIEFLSKIKTYKGVRHTLKYPVRGQRTHTNARTRKKIN